jgi:hypothetical protein
MAKAKRSEAQRANDKRLGEMARARAAKARKSSGHTHTHQKRAATSRAAAKPATSVVVVRQPAAAPAAKKASPSASAKRKPRIIPEAAMSLGAGLVDDVLIPVGIGGAAASGVDVLYGMSRGFIPATVVDHPVGKPLIKTTAGIVLAVLGQHMGLKPVHAKAAAVGVGIVQVHDAINAMVAKNTSVQLNGNAMTLGDLAAALPDVNGLEALGALAANNLGAVLPYIDQAAA